MLHTGHRMSEGHKVFKRRFSSRPQREQMERLSLVFVVGSKPLAEHSFTRHCWTSQNKNPSAFSPDTKVFCIKQSN